MATVQQELHNAHALQKAGNRAEARRCYERALKLDPANSRAWFELGTLALADRQSAQAITHFRHALELKPDFLEACCNLAATLQSEGKLDDAIMFYRRALELRPAFAEVHCNLGNALQARHDLPAAIASYREALRLKPDFAEVHNSLGVALKAQGHLADAIASYRAAIAAKPEYLSANVNLAIALNAREEWDEAVTVSRHAVSLKPRHTPALLTHGSALEGQGRLEEALGVYREILRHEPNHAGAQCNLGGVLQTQGKLDEAIAAYRHALALEPDSVEALTNLGTAFQARNNIADAQAAYQQALARQPDLAQTRFNTAVCQLLAGDFRAGWHNYEYRWQSAQKKFTRAFPQPLWIGQSAILGKRIFVYPEQGLGDTLQFVRYIPQLAARGAMVVLEVQPPLRALLSSFPGAESVVARGEPLPDFDVHCPLLSLPLAFVTELETIPGSVPYLHAPREKVEQWRSRFGTTPARRIGLVWSGGSHHKTDHLRSIPLEHFKRVTQGADAQFFSLQKDVKAIDADVLASTPEIASFSSEIHDFTDTAAIIEQLDLVISVDTSVAHLAGALGKPTWLLLPFAPDWRWMLDRSDSPWYPTMKLFRQPAPGDWDSVLEKVRAELTFL